MTGILMLSNGSTLEPILVSTLPTVVSINGGEPLEGRLVFARCMDEKQIARLSEVTHLPLVLYQYDDPEVPDKVRSVPASAETGVPTYVRARNDRRSPGTAFLMT